MPAAVRASFQIHNEGPHMVKRAANVKGCCLMRSYGTITLAPPSGARTSNDTMTKCNCILLLVSLKLVNDTTRTWNGQ
eukprot:1484674-Amphidinium_carterae.1